MDNPAQYKGVLLKASDYGTGSATVDWGDGSAVETVADLSVDVPHDYSSQSLGMRFDILATDGESATATWMYELKGFQSYATYDKGRPLGLGIGVVGNHPTLGTSTIDWGDGSAVTTATDEEAVYWHDYVATGVANVTVNETVTGSATSHYPVGTNLTGSPLITVTHVSGRRFRVEVIPAGVTGAGWVYVEWGDGDRDGIDPTAPVVREHTYLADGTYWIVSRTDMANLGYANETVVPPVVSRAKRKKKS